MRTRPTPAAPAFLRLLGSALLLAAVGACGGGSDDPLPSPPPDVDPPTGLAYAAAAGAYRVGEAIDPNVPSTTGGAPTGYTVSPALPAGLVLDGATGIVSGTPTQVAAAADYVVTAANAGGSAQTSIAIAVGAALPEAMQALASGFQAEVVLEPGVPVPPKIAKIAVTGSSDGRVFYTEVDTGNVRVIHPAQGLLATPFLTVNVLMGDHYGLLGLALAPDFETSGHVYVLATVPAGGTQNDRIVVLRYTDVGNVGTNRTIVLDDLPLAPPGAPLNNGGEILFDAGGKLFVSLGDLSQPTNAQADASVSLGGKILRYDVSTPPATIPGDNPFVGSPEWCRGLRNTFGLALHPSTGGLFGADNGAAANDELNFLQSGTNMKWGGNPQGANTRDPLRTYPSVIVPTGLCWHSGTGWGAAYDNSLFMVSYDEHTIRRFVMSGQSFTDIDEETVFAEFVDFAGQNHPLDVCMAEDGSLYVSTFSGIYRISKL